MPPKLASDPSTPLRDTLVRIGMSYAALARAVQVDRRDARRWIIGEHTPEPARREEIARVVSDFACEQVRVEELWPDADHRAGKAAA
jgi:transposase